MLWVISTSVVSAFGTVDNCKNQELLGFLHKLLVDISPLVFQLNLWLSGLTVRLVSLLSQQTQVIFREGMEACLVNFITRMCQVKTQTKYFSSPNSTYIMFGNTGVLWPWGDVSEEHAEGLVQHSGVYHKQVQTSWTVLIEL